MALVNREATAAISSQVYDFLGTVLRNVAADQIRHLANAITEDIVMTGRESAQAIRATIVSYAHEMQEDVGYYLREGAGQLQEITTELSNRGQQWIDMVNERGQAALEGVREATIASEQRIAARENWQRPVVDHTFENDAWDTHGEELPQLEDLDPMNGNGNGGNGSGSGRGNTDPEPTPETSAARMGVAGPGGSVSKETPISPYPSLSYGLQETHTTILPYRAWLSGGYLDHDSPLQLEIRMNAIWDILKSSITTLSDAGTIAAKAFHDKPVTSGGVHTTGISFPQAPVNGATERPQWRDFWRKFYEQYTVLGCEWKVVVINVNNSRGADIEAAVQYDSYSDTNGTTGNIMPKAPYAEVKAFKNIKWYRAEAATSENQAANNTMVITGTYKPGMISRNIKNDGDVKTWTACGTTLPTLKDILTINFFKAGLNYATVAQTAFNASIEVKYIVQFKDLIEQARYPSSVTTNQDIKVQINDTNDSSGVDGGDVRYRQSVS